MSFKDTIKEIKEQLAEAEVTEKTEEAEEIVETPEEPAEEEKPEPKPEVKPEEVKPEETNETPDQMAFQRLRREKAASDKRNRELEERISALETKPAETETAETKPELPAELQEIVQTHRMSQAEKEFQSLENKFRSSNPQYDAVASEYGNAIAQSFKIQNPRMSNTEIAEKTKETILKKAANYLNQGFDPIEELFNEAKELGFKGKKLEEKTEKPEEIKPDMKKVAANRTKSTGMGATNGKVETSISRAYIEQNGMPSPAEWKKLPSAEKRRLLYG